MLLPRLPAGPLALQQLQRLLRRDDVRDVLEVDALDKLRRLHVAHHLPERLAFLARPHVPNGVEDRAAGQRQHAFFGADPAQLAVLRQRAAEGHQVAQDVVLERQADNQVLERRAPGGEWVEASVATFGRQEHSRGCAHRGDDLVAAAEREGEAVARRQVGVVRVQDHVDARVLPRRRAVLARGAAGAGGAHEGSMDRREQTGKERRTSGSLCTASLPSPWRDVGYRQSTTSIDVMTVIVG